MAASKQTPVSNFGGITTEIARDIVNNKSRNQSQFENMINEKLSPIIKACEVAQQAMFDIDDRIRSKNSEFEEERQHFNHIIDTKEEEIRQLMEGQRIEVTRLTRQIKRLEDVIKQKERNIGALQEQLARITQQWADKDAVIENLNQQLSESRKGEGLLDLGSSNQQISFGYTQDDTASSAASSSAPPVSEADMRRLNQAEEMARAATQQNLHAHLQKQLKQERAKLKILRRAFREKEAQLIATRAALNQKQTKTRNKVAKLFTKRRSTSKAQASEGSKGGGKRRRTKKKCSKKRLRKNMLCVKGNKRKLKKLKKYTKRLKLKLTRCSKQRFAKNFSVRKKRKYTRRK